jgi:D-amino peptidase
MRVLVSVDMEGIAGVVDGEDVQPGNGEYERHRRQLTAEAGAAAALLHPDEACQRIEQEVPKALADRESVRPLRFDGPVLLEVDVLVPAQTERALLVPGVELAGGRTVRYAAPDFPTAYQVTQLITMLGGI